MCLEEREIPGIMVQPRMKCGKLTSVPMCYNERHARAHRQLQLRRLPAKRLTHVVGGPEEGIVMRSVWLIDATLQLSGECHRSLGKCRGIFPRLLRLIGERWRRRALSVDKLQTYDRRRIYFLLGRSRQEFVPRSTDQKDLVQAI